MKAAGAEGGSPGDGAAALDTSLDASVTPAIYTASSISRTLPTARTS